MRKLKEIQSVFYASDVVIVGTEEDDDKKRHIWFAQKYSFKKHDKRDSMYGKKSVYEIFPHRVVIHTDFGFIPYVLYEK